jgi:hypothetical protein
LLRPAKRKIRRRPPDIFAQADGTLGKAISHAIWNP